MSNTLTDKIYWDSKDPRIVALADIADPDARVSAAVVLDKTGLVIDRQIDLWRWQPSLVMALRKADGYPWSPNAFQPNLLNPFKLVSGPSTDMTQPWPRSIKVSTDAADYPAFAPPPPPLPVSNSPIGALNGDLYEVNIAVAQIAGQYLFKDGQTYTAKIKPTGPDQLEIQGCVLGFLCGGETWTRVAGPIPSSPSNSMAKGAPKASPKAGTTSANAKPGTPAPSARTTGHATAGHPADAVGDICLLPDIARFAH